jgi:hypothetical protein
MIPQDELPMVDAIILSLCVTLAFWLVVLLPEFRIAHYGCIAGLCITLILMTIHTIRKIRKHRATKREDSEDFRK